MDGFKPRGTLLILALGLLFIWKSQDWRVPSLPEPLTVDTTQQLSEITCIIDKDGVANIACLGGPVISIACPYWADCTARSVIENSIVSIRDF